ncbi:hypothetical protein BC829DRAFT_448309 [Chytridium lagenaria]|nr:hypothetical protein BC829DRAFT_448309 [Chytridium lagenaria]
MILPTFLLVIAASILATALPHNTHDDAPPSVCPPPGFDAVQDFYIDAYLGDWYLQASTITAYFGKNQFYCKTTIDVFNYSNNDTVNGVIQATVPSIRGTLLEPLRPSRLTVPPAFLPATLGGPYWVVAISPKDASGKYTWSVVSGGPPNEQSEKRILFSE